ncbi:hypothetical protein [Streptomyces sp. NPDC006477]|uniref:hypothetical protein n=1 Tax=Streptomyces sp. NPDC006477 TaxID=3364747 RepID=UPI00369CF3D3
MICRTPEEAFAAGLAEPCQHGKAPATCPTCQLSDLEISRLVVLHRDHTTTAPPAAPRSAQAA